MGVQICQCEGAIFSGKEVPRHARRHSAVSCAKLAEQIEMLFGFIIIIIIIIAFISGSMAHSVRYVRDTKGQILVKW